MNGVEGAAKDEWWVVVAVVERGELEGRLMADTGSPLETHAVKGAGSKLFAS
jgi:hypothetical protein